MNIHTPKETLYYLFKTRQKDSHNHQVRSSGSYLKVALKPYFIGGSSIKMLLKLIRISFLSQFENGHFSISERLFLSKKDVLLSSGCMEMCPKESFSMLSNNQKMDEV